MPLNIINNNLEHILLVYKCTIIEYLGDDQFATVLLDVLLYLYNIKIKVISIFESTGLVYNIAHTKLKTLLEGSGFTVQSVNNNSLLFSKPNGYSEDNILKCKLNYLHAPLAHLEILKLTFTPLRVYKKPQRVKGHYRIPPRKSIIQPRIASKLSISTPNLIIYIHPSFIQALLAFSSPLSHRFNSLKAILARFAAFPNRYISPFGASGVPPWALSEAEIYQIFSTSPSAIGSCIDLYTSTVLRKGK